MAEAKLRLRPGVGVRRKTQQPFAIDRLPESVRDSIPFLRNKRNRTWQEIADLSALPYDEKWAENGGGFIDWTVIDPDLLEEFPGLRLPKSNIHLWYKQRVELVRHEILVEAEASRAFAEKFAGASIEGGNEAVLNAMRDEVFALSRALDDKSRSQFLGQLNKLTLAMTRIQRIDIQRRKADADIAKAETERARIAATSGDPYEVYLQASNDLLTKLRTREAVRAVIDPIREELVPEITHAAEAFARQVKARAA
jgi:hypothetical protein